MKNKFKAFMKKYFTLDMLKFVVNVVFLAAMLILYPIQIKIYFKWIIASCLFLCYLIITEIIKSVQDERKSIPTAKKRFTKRTESGNIIIDETRFKEAILYLYEVQDRLYK